MRVAQMVKAAVKVECTCQQNIVFDTCNLFKCISWNTCQELKNLNKPLFINLANPRCKATSILRRSKPFSHQSPNADTTSAFCIRITTFAMSPRLRRSWSKCPAQACQTLAAEVRCTCCTILVITFRYDLSV